MSEGRRMSVAAGRALLGAAPDPCYASLFERGGLSIGLYAPSGEDRQAPHRRDEIYVVVEGRGNFALGEDRRSFGPGDLLFVPAGMPHRFEDFGETLLAWVIFIGPETPR